MAMLSAGCGWRRHSATILDVGDGARTFVSTFCLVLPCPGLMPPVVSISPSVTDRVTVHAG